MLGYNRIETDPGCFVSPFFLVSCLDQYFGDEGSTRGATPSGIFAPSPLSSPVRISLFLAASTKAIWTSVTKELNMNLDIALTSDGHYLTQMP